MHLGVSLKGFKYDPRNDRDSNMDDIRRNE